MARIYTYPNDAKLQDEDAWIGTNNSDKATVQFTAQKIADYLNIGGKVSIAGQIGFQYYHNQFKGEAAMTQSTGPSNELFGNLSVIDVHRNDIGGQLVTNFLNVLVGTQILISEANNIDNFGHYELQSITQNATNTDFYTLVINKINANGNLTQENFYYISSLNLASGGGGISDKHFVYNQNSASATWNITHNLSKKPSVSVVDTGDNVVYGSVEYNNLNSLTINFSSAFSGKAYLN